MIALFFLANNYAEILPLPPQSVHQWRQCDGASIAVKYAENGMHFFQPAAYNLHSDEGKTVGEFPVIYFLDALLIRWFGHPDLMIRGFNLLLFYLGLFFLYRTGSILLGNPWLAILPVIAMHSMPVASYYAATSVPDIPALGLMAGSVLFLLMHLRSQKTRHLLLGVSLACLAAVIKPTTLIAYAAVSVVVWWTAFTRSRQKLLLSTLLLLLPLACLTGWMFWAGRYNAGHQSQTFLMGIKPIWEMSEEWIDKTYYRMKDSWLSDYTYPPLFLISLAGYLLFLIWPKREWRLHKVFMATLLLGTAAYIVLFFEQFYHHDYYFIEVYPLLIAGFIGLLLVLKETGRIPVMQGMIAVGLAIVLALATWHCRKEMISRYTVDAELYAFNDDYFSLRPLLEASGLDRQSKVISYSDDSPNISLYLMGRMGWTRFPHGLDQARLEEYIAEGADALVVRNADSGVLSVMAPYLKELLIEHKSLQVWSVQMH